MECCPGNAAASSMTTVSAGLCPTKAGTNDKRHKRGAVCGSVLCLLCTFPDLLGEAQRRGRSASPLGRSLNSGRDLNRAALKTQGTVCPFLPSFAVRSTPSCLDRGCICCSGNCHRQTGRSSGNLWNFLPPFCR